MAAEGTRTRKWGAAIAVAAAVVVSAGGTAGGLALSSGGATVSTAATRPDPPLSLARPAPTPRAGNVPVPATPPTAPATLEPGASKLISDTCLYSHRANDDPILDPGRPGQSMAHDFFGNVSTAAASTASDLVGGSTTCSTGADASAYWTPVLSQGGVPVTPIRDLVYWAGLHAQDPAVTAPPAGLEMIAGDEDATAPQSTRVVGWRCADPMPQAISATPVDCAGTKGLELRLTFPSCWDGRTLNGANQTNVVYPESGSRCPGGYPVRIPTVIFHVVYPITSATGLTLSMGPGQQGSTVTAHGDFISGWNQSVLTALIDGCAGTAHTCGHVTGSPALVHPKKA